MVSVDVDDRINDYIDAGIGGVCACLLIATQEYGPNSTYGSFKLPVALGAASLIIRDFDTSWQTCCRNTRDCLVDGGAFVSFPVLTTLGGRLFPEGGTLSKTQGWQ